MQSLIFAREVFELTPRWKGLTIFCFALKYRPKASLIHANGILWIHTDLPALCYTRRLLCLLDERLYFNE